MVRQHFLATLESLGVRRLDPIGQPFDPAFHEAVSTLAPEPNSPSGTIVGIVRPGYVIGDEVLRAAQVAVAG